MSTKIVQWSRRGGIMAGAVALTILGAGPASADGPHYTLFTSDDNPGGAVEFFTDGDMVRLTDTQADGKDVEVDVWDVTPEPDVYKFGFYNRHGHREQPVVSEASDGAPYDLAEGHCIKFRIRLVNDGSSTVVPGSTNWGRFRNGSYENC
ncbi:hypothetical protein LRS74_32990 [Streptomyces sp. LX-29]|uniref:hypothetical protein n=1 Tax=Streptomyces sp. LX-29 TaxID=2900152 RepID=UPI00240E68EE|nr:hypothetical protein [Streptomyces sp. LX-29]WFB11318.1 hypothetical protein LRS74_32990 [Streptomyces sp. LX-29]